MLTDVRTPSTVTLVGRLTRIPLGGTDDEVAILATVTVSTLPGVLIEPHVRLHVTLGFSLVELKITLSKFSNPNEITGGHLRRIPVRAIIDEIARNVGASRVFDGLPDPWDSPKVRDRFVEAVADRSGTRGRPKTVDDKFIHRIALEEI